MAEKRKRKNVDERRAKIEPDFDFRFSEVEAPCIRIRLILYTMSQKLH